MTKSKQDGGAGGPGYAYSILQCKTEEQAESVVQAIQITERQRVVEMIESLDRWDEIGKDINGDYVLLSDLQSKLTDNEIKQWTDGAFPMPIKIKDQKCSYCNKPLEETKP